MCVCVLLRAGHIAVSKNEKTVAVVFISLQMSLRGTVLSAALFYLCRHVLLWEEKENVLGCLSY